MAVALALFAGTRPSAAPVKILALGSSLTQGYGLPPGTEFPVVLQARAEGGRRSTPL